MAKVLVSLPIYKGQLEASILASMARASRKHVIDMNQTDTSANATGMNLLWIKALEDRDAFGLEYFLMLHSDIIVDTFCWVDRMVEIMQRTGADILSAVSPIKNPRTGETSTALDEPVEDLPPKYRVRRLMMKEIFDREPTWTEPNLLLNDGCMLVDLSKPWCDKVHFHFDDAILWKRGKRMAFAAPEDWNFSRDARANGAQKLYATREIELRHIGNAAYPNTHPWGEWKTDQADPAWPSWKDEAVAAASRIQGYMTYEELAWLAEQARDKACVVEIGSWKGRSTKAMALAQESGVLYAVDHWRGTAGGDATGQEAQALGGDVRGLFNGNLLPELEAGRVIPLQIDHAQAVDALKARAEFQGADLVFIDGAHDYPSVKRDIQAALQIVRPGGVISGHDLNEPGVAQAVQEAFGGPDGQALWKRENGSLWAHSAAHPPAHAGFRLVPNDGGAAVQ